MAQSQFDEGARVPQDFLTTHWSLVVRAADPAAPDSQAALEALCRAYWFPLYAYVRRRGYSPEDARDLVQGFFALLLEKNSFAAADRTRGRFRTFLLSSMSHYLANERDRATAQKRGGRANHFSLDALEAEARYRVEPVDDAPPERHLDRRWAEAILEHVLAQLRREFDDAGRGQRFEDLKGYLLAAPDAPSYEELGARLGVSATGARSVVHRLRRRFAALVRSAVAQTVVAPEDVDDEIRHLLESLAP